MKRLLTILALSLFSTAALAGGGHVSGRGAVFSAPHHGGHGYRGVYIGTAVVGAAALGYYANRYYYPPPVYYTSAPVYVPPPTTVYVEQPPVYVEKPAPIESAVSISQRLERLTNLYARGQLSQQEYQDARARVLAGL